MEDNLYYTIGWHEGYAEAMKEILECEKQSDDTESSAFQGSVTVANELRPTL